MKKISLIIPIYNTKEYLRQCLDSAVCQTYQNMEIICIDDGSTDGSGEILDEFAGKNSRIVAVHQKNKGESAARNTGLRMATGDYIGFMDCDDWIELDMYEKLIQVMEDNEADIAVGSWIKELETESIFVENKGVVERNVFGREELLNYIYQRDSYQAFAYMWDKLYKRELLTDENGELLLFREDLKLGGDVLYLAQIVLKSKKAVFLNECFYHYRQRDDSGCHSVDLNKRMDWIKAYQIIIKLFQEQGISEDVLVWIKRFMAYHCSNVAEIAYEQRDKVCCKNCCDLMKLYEKEYITTNLQYPERIERYKRIMNMGE